MRYNRPNYPGIRVAKMSPSTLIDRLRALPYFEQCAPATLDLLVARAIQRRFAAGEAIFHEGDPSLGFWLIERGSVKIHKINPDGIEHILHFHYKDCGGHQTARQGDWHALYEPGTGHAIGGRDPGAGHER